MAETARINQALAKFLDGEERFNNGLALVVEVYVYTFMNQNNPTPAPGKDFTPIAKYIFLHLDTLYAAHSRFVGALSRDIQDQPAAEKVRCVVRELTTHQNDFEIFLDYTQNLIRAQALLEKLTKKRQFVLILARAENAAGADERAQYVKDHRLSRILDTIPNHVNAYTKVLQSFARSFDEGSQTRADCEALCRHFEDMELSIECIKRDSEELRVIENLQNNILSFPKRLIGVNMSQDDRRSFGWERNQLREFGHLRAHSMLRIKPEGGDKSEMYVILMDEMILLSQPWGKKKQPPYSYFSGTPFKSCRITRDGRLKDAFMIRLELWDRRQVSYRCKSDPAIVNKWIAADRHLADYQNARAEGQQHNLRKFTFPPSAVCNACQRRMRGCFFQGYTCVNTLNQAAWGNAMPLGENTQNVGRMGCHQQLHRECLASSLACRRTANTPLKPEAPGIPAWKWDVGAMGEEAAKNLLALCPKGTYLVRTVNHQLEDGEEERRQYISMAKCDSADATTPGIVTAVHRRIYYEDDEGYSLDFLFLDENGDHAFKYFNDIPSLINFYKDWPNVNWGTHHQTFRHGPQIPLSEGLRTWQRTNGAFFMDWITPSIDLRVLIKYGIVARREDRSSFRWGEEVPKGPKSLQPFIMMGR